MRALFGSFGGNALGAAGTFIDIAIVSLIFYRLLVLAVGTRAMQLLKGILVLVIFAMAARFFQLKLISWLISHAFWAMSFAIPLVFQPELRKMLEELGRGRFWQKSMTTDEAEIRTHQVLSALDYMKAHRIGALLVLQQESELGEYWQTAIHINAEISQELIISIFWKDNPLHDGAIIMDRYSIIAGGCYLPLADVPEMSRWYGTRHRAAIGMSEASDAVVLVVSEERGEVSMAFRGKLSDNLKDPQLEKFLRHYFAGKQKNTKLTLGERIKKLLKFFWTRPEA